jgi:hypothetical protein
MKRILTVLAAALGTASLPLAAQSGWISASPNPCVIPQGQSSCTTTLTWSSSQTQLVQVWVSVSGGSEVLFASSGGGGPHSQSAPWIQASGLIYSFRLYNYSSGTRGALLSLIEVTAVSGPNNSCPIATVFAYPGRAPLLQPSPHPIAGVGSPLFRMSRSRQRGRQRVEKLLWHGPETARDRLVGAERARRQHA